MKNILITGGGGFVGSHLIPQLNKLGYNLTIINGKKEFQLLDYQHVDDLNDDNYFLYTDLVDKKFDYIIHLAIKTAAGGYCYTHPGEQFLENQEINNIILKYWKEHQPQAKMIAFGTSCAYDPYEKKVEENYLKGECEPGYEVYGNIKRNLLVGCKALQREWEMDYIYLIPSTIYGPGYKLGDQHFIYELIRKIVDGKYYNREVVLWGDGTQERELIHIDDVCEIIEKRVIKGTPGGWAFDKNIVNLSHGVPHDIKFYAKIICNYLGYDFEKIKWDITQFVGSKSKHLINSQLGDHKFVTSKEGIEKTIDYYLQNL